MLNKVILMGRLTRDPEMRYTQSNIPYCRFTVAVDRHYSKEKQADFISVVAWRGTAEFVGKYFNKGKMIVVVGSLQTGSYEKDGVKHYTTDVAADEVHFGESKREESEGVYPSNHPPVPNQSSSSNFSGEFVPIDADDDLPF